MFDTLKARIFLTQLLTVLLLTGMGGGKVFAAAEDSFITVTGELQVFYASYNFV